MSEKSSAESLQRLVDELSRARSLLILTHNRPDGDALGSMRGLALSASATGRQAWGVVAEVPGRYEFLFDTWRPEGLDRLEELADRAERIVVVDTASYRQLSDVEKVLHRHAEKMLVVDHHQTGQDVGACQWVDSQASSAAIMIQHLLEQLDWPRDLQVAEALAVGVLTDTGWLRFSNTDARTLRSVAEWVAQGVSLPRLYAALYQNDRPERIRLLRRVLDSLELHEDDRLAMMSLRLQDFAETSASPDQISDFVNEPFRVGAVELVILLTETDSGVRVSFRSRRQLDVAQLAGQFGGGGHARAAGARLATNMDSAREKLLAAGREALHQAVAE